MIASGLKLLGGTYEAVWEDHFKSTYVVQCKDALGGKDVYITVNILVLLNSLGVITRREFNEVRKEVWNGEV